VLAEQVPAAQPHGSTECDCFAPAAFATIDWVCSERHLRGMNRFVYDLTEIAERLRFLPLDERGAYRRP
jgi:hypothetical protein